MTRNLTAWFALLLSHVSAVSGLQHHHSFATGFNLSWGLDADATIITFTMAWNNVDDDGGRHDWAAFGLHPAPGSGMADAEIFMCSPSSSNTNGTFCQVRNSNGGYVTPSVDKEQYIDLVSSSVVGNRSVATFRRKTSKNQASPRSVDITNTTLGLVHARGPWTSPSMPSGQPSKHTSAARDQLNFFTPSPTPPPPPVPPSPKHAGVWPDHFVANMTIARDQLIVGGSLNVSFYAVLKYDFPARSQLWEYYELDNDGGPGKGIGGELWVDTYLYSLGGDGTCYTTNLGFDILRPNWLQGTTYDTTNFVLRQPNVGESYCSQYQLADLYKIPNSLGMTNSWVVANSSIAAPIRLMGPDDFDEPSWRSILEYSSFEPVDGFANGTFAIPKNCNRTDGTAEGFAANKKLAVGSPSRMLAGVAKSLQ